VPALVEVRELGDPADIAATLDDLGRAQLRAGDARQSIASLLEAIDVWQQASYTFGHASSPVRGGRRARRIKAITRRSESGLAALGGLPGDVQLALAGISRCPLILQVAFQRRYRPVTVTVLEQDRMGAAYLDQRGEHKPLVAASGDDLNGFPVLAQTRDN